MNKDLIIFNLLFGWEIIHLSKKGRKVSIRFREFPDKGCRFENFLINTVYPKDDETEQKGKDSIAKRKRDERKTT